MRKELVKISKFLSLVLRHKPEEIGLTLDENGWADVRELLDKMASFDGRLYITEGELFEVVATNNKKRFSFNDDNSKIRASQGHSIKVDVGLEPKEPPEFLYHGTSVKSVQSIIAEGIKPMSRQHVHLSKDKETAKQVGGRHGCPVILTVRAGKMFREMVGYDFYLSENKVWLTDKVPIQFIQFVDSFNGLCLLKDDDIDTIWQHKNGELFIVSDLASGFPYGQNEHDKYVVFNSIDMMEKYVMPIEEFVFGNFQRIRGTGNKEEV